MISNLYNNKIVKNYHEVTLLFFFYAICHGGMLLILNSIYWDDWTLYGTNPEIIKDTFKQAGSPFNATAYLHLFLLIFGPWIYRILTFLLMFAAGICLNEIIKKYNSISDHHRFLLVLLFLVLPFNFSRVALIVMPYTLCYFLFFLAWLLIDRFRYLSLLLFFLSFITNSLLVFYALPIADHYYRKSSGKLGFKNIYRYICRNPEFVILPFIFFYVKVYYYSPYGLYAGYNEKYRVLNIFRSVIGQLLDLLSLEINYQLLLIMLAPIYLLLVKHMNGLFRLPSKFLLVGIAAGFLAVFPYWVLRLTPTFTDWTSRHQLLMPLGCAIIIVVLSSMLPTFIARIFIAVLVSACLSLNIETYRDLYLDWKKQKDLIQLFSIEKKIKDADLIIINDNTSDLNALKRLYKNYEWNGLLWSAFNDEKRFGIYSSDTLAFFNGNFYRGYYTHGSHYRSASFSFKEAFYFVSVTINSDKDKSYGLIPFYNEPTISLSVDSLRIRKISPMDFNQSRQ